MNNCKTIGAEDKSTMLVVAVTGRSGSGKSTVSAYFAQQGYPVLDADEVAREVTLPGSPCLIQLAQAFGEDVLTEDGTLRRQRLAARAFATEDGVRKLTEITHPEIVTRLLGRIQEAQQTGARMVFVDGAVIIGGLFEPHCDQIIVVTAPVRDAITRIVLRDGISKEAARERLAAQLSEETLCVAADYILVNNSTKQALLWQADKVLANLQSKGDK